MNFLYPALLWLLLPLGLLLWRSVTRLQTQVHIVILMLILLALSRPVFEHTLQKAHIEAKDIVIALDVSYSMRATDLTPSRYAFAKETINALLRKNPSDNIMLIAFTTNPLLLSPPTTDHALISIALESLNPEFILTKGTSLKALFTKLGSLNLEHKNLILMTDGGEENDITTLSLLLQNTDLHTHILALGTTKGTTVQNNNGSLLMDKQDNLVVSRINPLLETLSNNVNGAYFTALATPQKTAEILDKSLRQNESDGQQVEKMQRYYAELYVYPLLLAIILFLVVHTKMVKYLIVLLSLFGLQAHANIFDGYHLKQAYAAYQSQEINTTISHLKKLSIPSLQSQLLLANSYYRQRAFKKAIKLYKSIHTTSISVKQNLYFNIANAYTQLQAYDKAKIYYTKTLQLGKDDDASHNLALIALLKNPNDASLGIAHPKSQSASSSKSESQENEKEREEDKPSSGSGGGANASTQKQQDGAQIVSSQSEQQPLGSKVYELINKGYIRETQPW